MLIRQQLMQRLLAQLHTIPRSVLSGWQDRWHWAAAASTCGGALIAIAVWLSGGTARDVKPSASARSDAVQLFAAAGSLPTSRSPDQPASSAGSKNLAAFTRGGRLEQLADRVRFGVEGRLLLDENDNSVYWTPPGPLSLSLSFADRRPIRVHSVRISLATQPQRFAGKVRVSGSLLGAADGWFQIGQAAAEAGQSDPAVSHAERATLHVVPDQETVVRFIKLDFDDRQRDKHPWGLAEIRVVGVAVDGGPYNVCAQRFGPVISSGTAAASGRSSRLASGVRVGAAGDSEDPVWASSPKTGLPADVCISFPRQTAFVQTLTFDTRLPRELAKASPTQVEVFSTAGGGAAETRLALLRIPAAPGVHAFQLAEEGRGFAARSLRLRIRATAGQSPRAALREAAVYGFYAGPLDTPRSGSSAQAVTPTGDGTPPANGESEPNDDLQRPQALTELGRETEQIIRGALSSPTDVDVYSFSVDSPGEFYTFVLSEVAGADTRFAVLGPDHHPAYGVRTGAAKPETHLVIDDLARPGRELASGWPAPAVGEYFIIIGMQPQGRPGPYRLTVRRRS